MSPASPEPAPVSPVPISPVPISPVPISAVATELAGRALLGQSWRRLTFLHWRVPSEQVAPLLPVGTRPDEFDGSSWVGLIPFRLTDAWIGAPLPLPWVGSFAETNVRLYSVDAQGRRGVVFRTLESQRLAFVLGAQLALGLPYRWSRMSVTEEDNRLTYASHRRRGRSRPGSRVTVEIDETAPVVDDPQARFLTARWGLHTRHLGRTLYLPNTHRPWTLRPARLIELQDDLLAHCGFPGLAARPPDSVLYSDGVSTTFGRGSVV